MERDAIKYVEGMLLGWVVFRVTPGMVKSGVALQYV